MSSSFHEQAFRLLGKKGEVKAAAVAKLEAQEAKLGFRFPASVRDWLSRGGKDVLGKLVARHNDGVKELSWAKLGGHIMIPDVIDKKERYDPAAEGVILLLTSRLMGNWAVGREGDDPPVYFCLTLPAKRWDGSTEWEQTAATFSDFVLGCVWQFRMATGERADGSLIGTLEPPLRPRDFALLLAHFEEGPGLVAVNDNPIYLFRRDTFYLCIQDARKSQGTSDAAWWAAGDRDELAENLALMRQPAYLFGEEYPAMTFGTADAVWAELNEHPPPFPGPGWEQVFGTDLVALFARGELLDGPREPALPPPHVDFLIDHLEEKHRRTFPHGLTAYHFAAPDARLLLVSEDHATEGGRSSWWLHGNDSAALLRLLRLVWPLGGIGEGLTGRSEAAAKVLARVRDEG